MLKSLYVFPVIWLLTLCHAAAAHADQAAGEVAGQGADQAAETLLTRINEAGTKVNSAQFDIHYRSKRISRTDTADFFGSYQFVLVPEDTIVGRHFRYEYFRKGAHRELIYAGDTLWVFNHSTRSVDIINPHVREYWELNSLHHEIMSYPELRGFKKIGNEITSDTLFMRPGPTPAEDNAMSQDLNTYHYLRYDSHFKGPDYEIISQTNLKVDSATLRITRIEAERQAFGDFQYDCAIFSNIHTNLTEIAANIRDFSIPAGYSVKYLMDPLAPKPASERPPLLAKGKPAPQFSGTLLDGSDFTFDASRQEDSDTKLFLLDFWYINCGPCQMAMPHLQNLHSELREEGLHVIGMNHTDVTKKSKPKLRKFLQKREFDYTQVLIEPDVAKEYSVHAYPTLYLVNTQGKVVYAEAGFSKMAMDQLADFIKDYLKQH